jgi:hypothetical protein
MNYNEFEQIRSNFYRKDNKTYRLFGTGITDNGCWVINPKMVEIEDIDINTGNDVYGEEIVIHDVTGTVPVNKSYLKY